MIKGYYKDQFDRWYPECDLSLEDINQTELVFELVPYIEDEAQMFAAFLACTCFDAIANRVLIVDEAILRACKI